MRDVSRADWIVLWQTCTSANNPQALIDKTTPALTNMFATIKGDLKAGDIMRATYRPDEGTALILNDTPLGDIYPNKDIFTLLINYFVGNAAPSPEFHANVLGGPRDPALVQRYVSLQPTSQRKQEVAAWKLDTTAPNVGADRTPCRSNRLPTDGCVCRRNAQKSIRLDALPQLRNQARGGRHRHPGPDGEPRWLAGVLRSNPEYPSLGA